jgi:hypothetical protein
LLHYMLGCPALASLHAWLSCLCFITSYVFYIVSSHKCLSCLASRHICLSCLASLHACDSYLASLHASLSYHVLFPCPTSLLPPSINTSIGTPSNFCDTCVTFPMLGTIPVPPMLHNPRFSCLPINLK